MSDAPIELLELDLDNLRRIAASEPVDFGALRVMDGALPPPPVALRALSRLQAAMPARWCVPFLVLSSSRGEIVGGCGFKAAPHDGCVEIGYGIAPDARGRGIATAAVQQLLQRARNERNVRQVLAYVVPENLASARVVARAGFSRGPLQVDVDGETVVCWSFRYER